MFPDVLKEQPFKCYIASTLSGPFQTIFCSARMGEVQVFGKYLKYMITPSDQPVCVNVEGQKQPFDAFHLLIDIQVTLCVPKKVTDERTGKDRMKNKVIDLLEQKRLGWSASYVTTTGRKFVDLLTDVLWYLDGCHKTFEGRRLSVPHIFCDISGFNKP